MGFQYNGKRLTMPERKERIRKAHEAFHHMHSFWSQEAVPFTHRRSVFIGKILNTLLLNSEVLTYTKQDELQLNKTLVFLGRKALGGEATIKTMGQDREIIYRAIPAVAVLRRWQVAPFGVEARIRRLGMLQTWVRDPGNHSHALSAVLGTIKSESNDCAPLDLNGVPTEHAPPLAEAAG